MTTLTIEGVLGEALGRQRSCQRRRAATLVRCWDGDRFVTPWLGVGAGKSPS